MANQSGLLELAFENALRRATDDELFYLHQRPDVIPVGAPRTEFEAVSQVLDVYRANQALIDAAVRGALPVLTTAEGAAQLAALQGAIVDGVPTELGRSIAGSMLQADSFNALNARLKDKEWQNFGVGIAGDVLVPGFSGKGMGGGYEWMIKGDIPHRWWVDYEEQIAPTTPTSKIYPSGFTVGLSMSFWENTPLTGAFFGVVAEITAKIDIYPIALRFMVAWQRAALSTSIEFAGFAIELGAGIIQPYVVEGLLAVAGGGFIGYQKAKSRNRRLKLSVVNQATKGHTITVNTEATLAVTITAEYALSFEDQSNVYLHMPTYFATDDVSAMTVVGAPDYWDVSTNGRYIVFTANQAYDWDEGSTISFTIENVLTAGTADRGNIQDGTVQITAGTSNYPATAHDELDLVWEQFAVTITKWEATVGNGPLTLGAPCAGQSSCSGTNIIAYSQNNTDVTNLCYATDGDGVEWSLGYQFNYDSNGDGTYTTHFRAVVWKTTSSTAYIPYAQNWYPDGTNGTTSASYDNTTGNTTIAITIQWS